MTDHLVDEQAGGLGDDSDPSETPAERSSRRAATGAAIGRWRERRRHRVSRWDRPPAPKDWRYVVGTLGKVLIATGLLMFGFVAYQLWGTGIETARAQSALEDGFREQVGEISRGDEPAVGFENWTKPTTDGQDDSDDANSDETEIDDTDDTETDGDDTDIGLTDVGEDPLEGVPSIDPGPPSDSVPGGVDLSDFAIDQDVPIVPGDSFALIEIPKIDVSTYVVPGVTLTDLKRGIGHYPDTPLPGQLGNASLAGHRTTYGAPFFDLDRLVPGDEIEVTMVTGDRFVYRVTGAEVVSAADYWVVTTRDPNVAELTLTTCDPKYTARNRLVIHSVLVPEKSSQVGVAEYYGQGDGTGEEILGDDPTLVAEPIDPDVAADLSGDDTEPTPATSSGTTGVTVLGSGSPDATAATVPDSSAPTDGATDAADDADDAPSAGDPGDGDAADGDAAVGDAPPTEVDPDSAELDAFSQGWFDDGAAFPQIALWGVALVIISLLAYQVSKRTRHHSVGVLVGVAPFLICLYFFYQNVNRLLPPGL